MNHQNKHRGTIVPMATPLTKDLGLDVQAAERMVDRLASHGLGAFVLGTTGEAASVPTPMRSQLVEIAAKVADSRVPVYAGIGDNCVLDSLASAQEFLKRGADAVVAPLPGYYLLDSDEMINYYQLLAEQINGPLVIYNIPQTTRMSIPVDVVAKLSELANVVAFKDSENAEGRLEQVAKLGGRDDFSIFMGIARNALQALVHNYDGLVPSSGNLVPEHWTALVDAFAKDDLETAVKLQTQVDEIAQIFQRGRSLGQSLAALKTCLYAIGQCQPFVLPPLKSLPLSELGSFRKQLEEFNIVATPVS